MSPAATPTDLPIPFPSTVAAHQLLMSGLLRHGQRVFAQSIVHTSVDADTRTRSTFAEVATRAEKLASVLDVLEIPMGERVATLMWNTQQHLEAYLGIPSSGRVLHTLNVRLSAEQLAYIVEHADDRVVMVDPDLVPLLLKVLEQAQHRVERVICTDSSVTIEMPDGIEVSYYEDLMEQVEPIAEWPAIDERSGAIMCYTSGTTGHPKGVVYSHRSTYLHAMAVVAGNVTGMTTYDTVLPAVPMFHANAWGYPFAAWLSGADLALPGRYLQADVLVPFLEHVEATIGAAVPTIWADVESYARANGSDLTTLRLAASGGAQMTPDLIAAFKETAGLYISQAWGMTETNALGAFALPPKEEGVRQNPDWTLRTARVIAGVEARIVADDGTEIGWDGETVGELQVRGPWVTAAYFGVDSLAAFDDGWLRTGDVARIDRYGYIQITDRLKDLIKSGGEWISSQELENAISDHQAVQEVSVVGMADEKWQERPLAYVVLRDGEPAPGVLDLRESLRGRIPSWWTPENWAFVESLPRTTVGKIDKAALRARAAAGDLDILHP